MNQNRELVFKEDGQEYAQVVRINGNVRYGNGRCEAMCADNVKRLCYIRARMHRTATFGAGDVVLVSLRGYQDDKAEVILKYMPYEARLLKAYGELPDNVTVNGPIDDNVDAIEDYVH